MPISHNETIILKSMLDYNIISTEKQTNENICSIYEEYLKKAKPIQFPYSSFLELYEFEKKSPISLLLAHLYYKHNNTNEGTFKDVVNECCDIIDDTLIPKCNISEKIKIVVGDCIEKDLIMEINYKNCKLEENDGLPRSVECSYIPHGNYKGFIIECFVLMAFIIEIFFFIIIIKNRKERTVILAGFRFLLFLLLFTIILNLSAYFWIGSFAKYKCVLKIWSMIIGITGFICSYSIKSEFIVSVYNNTRITNSNNNAIKNQYFYVFIAVTEFILLLVWSFSHEGVVSKTRYLSGIGYYEYETCSNGNENILGVIFVFDYILLLLSIVLAYRGRNIPNEFNYSKKIFFTSLISILLLTLCYITTLVNIESIMAYLCLLGLIIIISLVVNFIFIGNNILTIFNINPDTFTVMIDGKNSSGDEISLSVVYENTKNSCGTEIKSSSQYNSYDKSNEKCNEGSNEESNEESSEGSNEESYEESDEESNEEYYENGNDNENNKYVEYYGVNGYNKNNEYTNNNLNNQFNYNEYINNNLNNQFNYNEYINNNLNNQFNYNEYIGNDKNYNNNRYNYNNYNGSNRGYRNNNGYSNYNEYYNYDDYNTNNGNNNRYNNYNK